VWKIKEKRMFVVLVDEPDGFLGVAPGERAEIG
jgi:hypothetical protein